MMKLSFIALFLCSFSLGCVASTHNSLRLSEKSIGTTENSPKNIVEPDGRVYKPVNIVDLLRKGIKEEISHHPESKNVLQHISQQESKLIEIVDVCALDFNPTYAGFSAPFKVDNERYVIPFVCTTGIRVPSFRLFLYSEQDGIQTTPLKLVTLDVDLYDETGEEKRESAITFDKKITSILHGLPRYDKSTKELTIESDYFRCNGNRCSYIGKYIFEQDGFTLKEYSLIGKDIHDQIRRYKQIYP